MTLTNNQTRRMVTLGVLSALGAVLMILEIPYPFVGFLQIDLSDVVVLLIFAMYGWKEAAAVGILKALVHLLAKGPVMGTLPIPIGQLTAFFASMAYVLAMYVWSNRFRFNKWVSGALAILTVTVIMTVLNYFFITPVWFGTYWYTEIATWVTPSAFGLNMSGGYLWTIILVYVPFNIIKGIIVVAVYMVIFEAAKAYFNYLD